MLIQPVTYLSCVVKWSLRPQRWPYSSRLVRTEQKHQSEGLNLNIYCSIPFVLDYTFAARCGTADKKRSSIAYMDRYSTLEALGL